MFRLHVHRPGMAPEVHTIQHDVATIGRSRECDVAIDDPEVSRRHTKVLRGLVVLDLGSRNGTWIDQTRVSEATRVPASRFLIGQGERAIAIDVVADEAAAAAPEAADEYEATITVPRDSATKSPGVAPMAAAATPPPPAAAAPAAAPAIGAVELAQLRTELERQRQRAYEAGRELEALKGGRDASQAAASSELAAARLEVMQLRQRLGSLKSELEASAQAGQQGLETRLLQQKLEASEQRATTLERRVRELESQPAAPAANMPMSEFVARMQRELMRVQAENGELKAQLARGAGATTAAAPAAPPLVLPPAPPMAPRPVAPAGAGARRVELQPLCGAEFEKFEAPADAELHDFALVSSLRFLRAVERVVAYSAREFVGLLEMRTIVPDQERNLAAWLSELLAAPGDVTLRRGLDGYLRDLSRWLVAGMTAYKSAAREFVLGVKKSLSEEALGAATSISSFKKLTGQGDAELWKRAKQQLAELSPDTIDDRIERLAREIAGKVLAGAPPPAAS